MTQRTRTLLFVFLSILFFAVTPLTIFYSLGWRVDIKNYRIIKTGVFYAKIWPKYSQIYINGKLAKKTDLFFGTALVENLLPDTYNFEVKKDGFLTWKKTLPIQENIATEVRNILLVPDKPVFSPISQNVLNYFVSPDENKAILQESQPIPSDPGWFLELLNLQTNTKGSLTTSEDIIKNYPNLSAKNNNIELADVIFSDDSQFALLKIKNSSVYLLADLNKDPISLSAIDLGGVLPEQIIFNPTDENVLLALSANNILQINLPQTTSGKTNIQTKLEDVLSFEAGKNNFYYLNSGGYIFKTDYSLTNPGKVNQDPLPIDKSVKYQIFDDNPRLLVKGNNTIYFLNNQTQNFEELLDQAPNMALSPDAKKIAIFDNKNISVVYLVKQTIQPEKLINQKSFLANFEAGIDSVFWLENNNLIVKTGREIKIIEIDDRDKPNIFTLGTFTNPKIFLGENSKKLYILDDENLYSSERLAP